MYELFVFDLDGTLLDSKKKISERTLEALERLRKMGAKIVVCTGRSFLSFKPFMDLLNFGSPTILQNGAIILSEDGRILRQSILDVDFVEKLLKIFGLMDSIVFTFSDTPPDRFVNTFSDDNPFLNYINSTRDFMKSIDDPEELFELKMEFAEVGIFRRKEMRDEIVERLKNEELIEKISLITSNFMDGVGFFEFFGPEVSKGMALIFLKMYLGVPLERMVFIGDNYNDMDAMEIVGLSVAMGNSPDEVKRLADIVIPSNDEDGIPYLVNEMVVKGGLK